MQHELAIKRRIDRHADNRADREKRGTGDRAGHLAAQDRKRNQRLARGQKPGRKQPPQHRRGRDEADDRPGQPAKLRAAPIERQQQRHRGSDHQRHARDIEFVRAVVPRQAAQRPTGHHQRDGAERQIDPEDERPMQMIGEEPAEHRAEMLALMNTTDV